LFVVVDETGRPGHRQIRAAGAESEQRILLEEFLQSVTVRLGDPVVVRNLVDPVVSENSTRFLRCAFVLVDQPAQAVVSTYLARVAAEMPLTDV
jgi:hypothetical protein